MADIMPRSSDLGTSRSGGADSPFTVRRQTPSYGRFDRLGEGLSPRIHHAVATWGHRLYIFGGEVPHKDPRADTQLLNDLLCYDTNTERWRVIQQTEHSRWPDRRKGHTLVTAEHEDYLILFGGSTTLGQAQTRKISKRSFSGDPEDESIAGGDVIYFNDVWKFDCATELWTEFFIEGEKPRARSFHSANIFGNFMFIFGGYGCHEDQEIWVLDMGQMSWETMMVEKASIRPGRRFAHVSAFFNRSFYIFGGQTKSKICDSAVWNFQTQDGLWRRIDAVGNGSALPSAQIHHR